MNLHSVNSIYSDYFLISTKSKLILPTIKKKIFMKQPTWSIPTIIHHTQILQLPFIIKLRFIKTIKMTVPQVTYQYISKPNRLVRSFNYPHKIQSHQVGIKNSHNPHLHLYNLILKI